MSLLHHLHPIMIEVEDVNSNLEFNKSIIRIKIFGCKLNHKPSTIEHLDLLDHASIVPEEYNRYDY